MGRKGENTYKKLLSLAMFMGILIAISATSKAVEINSDDYLLNELSDIDIKELNEEMLSSKNEPVAILPLDEQEKLLISTKDKNISKVKILFGDGTVSVEKAEGRYAYKSKNNLDVKFLYNQVKDDFNEVTYESFYNHLKPYESFLDKSNIRLELLKKTGKNPTEEEITQELKKFYLEKLDMKGSFAYVKDNLQMIMEAVFENSSDVQVDYIKKNKISILFGLTFLERQYKFEFGNIPAKDLILYYPEVFGQGQKDALKTLVDIGTMSYNGAELPNSAKTYTNKISKVTNKPDIIQFIEKGISIFENDKSLKSYLEKNSKAYIVETISSDINKSSSLVDKMRVDEDIKAQLIPLLTLTNKSLYVISTTNTINYGLTDTYMERKDSTGISLDAFKENVDNTARHQQLFLDFWYRITDKKEDFVGHKDIIVVDTMQKYGNAQASASTLWSPKYGDGVLDGIREFITPFNLYAKYMFADGQASGSNKITFYVAKGLTDRGQAVYTHELTHMLDKDIWFNGYNRRRGKGPEVFARGLFESINNKNSGYNPIFNLNTAYTLGENRVQNSSPKRFQNEEDLKEYMKGVFDVIYTLDYAEAKAILEKDNQDRIVLLNKVDIVSDSGDGGKTNDRFSNLTLDEANKLEDIDDFISNNIVSGRLSFEGIKSIGDTMQNSYYVVPLFEPIYAALQNDSGTSGDITFRRNSYEILAEYGYRNGMAAYLSGKYLNDKDALNAILDVKYHGNLAEFKKDMFKRRIDNIKYLNESKSVRNFEDLMNQMREAVNQDLAKMKAEGSLYQPKTTVSTNINSVRTLKEKVFQEYLKTTNDFRTSIYTIKPVEIGNIIYVRNGEESAQTGQGTKDIPYDSLKYAISKAKDGDIIKLVEDIQFRPVGADNTFKIDKDIAIDGQKYRLTFRGLDLVLENNLKLQNMTLNMIPEGTNSPKIYVGGNELVIDSVYTKITQTDNRKPMIIGGVKEGQASGSNAKIRILNGSSDTAFKKIIAGNENDDSYIPASIVIDSEFVAVDDGIYLGSGNNSQTTEKISLISNSKNIKLIDGTNSIDNEVLLKDFKFYSLQLKNIINLALENKAELSLNNTELISGNVDIKDGTKLSINGNKILRVGNLLGTGEISLGLDTGISVENNIVDPISIKVNGTEDKLLAKVGTVYVVATGDINELTNVSLSNLSQLYRINKEGKTFKLENMENPLNTYAVTLKFKHQGRIVSEKSINVQKGADISIQSYIPTSDRGVYQVVDGFDYKQLNNIRESKEIVIDLINVTQMEPILNFDKTSVQKMELIENPTKVEYREGEFFEVSGAKVKLIDENGISQIVGSEMFSEYGIVINKTEQLKDVDYEIKLYLKNKWVTIPITVLSADKSVKYKPKVNEEKLTYEDTISIEDAKSQILSAVTVSDKAGYITKEIIGEIPLNRGEQKVCIRITYDDESFVDVFLNVEVVAEEAGGWKKEDDKWKYTKKDGQRAISEWLWLPVENSDEKVYKYFDREGNSIDQFYEETKDGETKYYLSQSGPFKGYKKGWWTDPKNNLVYYFRPATGSRVEGRQHIDGGWKFFRFKSGSQAFGWQYINRSWSYFDNTSGNQVIGKWAWLKLMDGQYNWKYFDGRGINIDQFRKESAGVWLSQTGPEKSYYKGWWTDSSNGQKYYFRTTSGSRVEGRQYIDGNWYYFRKGSGTQAFGKQYVDGVWRYYHDTLGREVR